MMQLHRANSMAARPSAARRAVQQAPGMHIRAPLQAPRLAQAAIARGRIAHVARAGKIREITESELEVEVANRDRPLIIDFFATWCGPCVLLAKELEQVAEAMGDRVRILKIDTDKNEQISAALQIQGLPTMVFVGMDPSKPALRTEGLLPAQSIIDIVEAELLAPAAEPAPPAE